MLICTNICYNLLSFIIKNYDNAHLPDCPIKMQNLINWFQGKPDSGGNTAAAKYQTYVIGGVPSRWNELSGDSRTATVWKSVYDSLDGIHPWLVGRWTTITNFNNYYNNVISRDASYCASKGILYMPTMWPGFSWHNLKNQQVCKKMLQLSVHILCIISH